MEDFDVELRRAKNAVIARDFNLAIRLYKSILEKEGENIELLSELGSLYIKSNDDEKALDCYKKILELKADDFNAMNSIGGIYRRMKKYDESVEILKKALSTGKNNAEANYNLGFTYKFMGKNEDAVECFENVIAEKPTDVLAYNHLGSIYASQNNHEKAIDSYRHGLQIDPNHPILLYNLAKSCQATHDEAGALNAYDNALKAKPGWQEAVLDYSSLLLEKRKTKAAGELVQNAIGLHPKDYALYVQMGKILMRQSNFEKAASSFEIANRLATASSRNETNAEIVALRATALSKQGKTELADLEAEKALKADGQNPEIKKQAAEVYLSGKKLSEAESLIKELQNSTLPKAVSLNLLGQNSIVSGKDNDISSISEQIKNADSNYVDFYYDFAERYNQVQNYDEAKKYAQLFIDEKMKDVAAWILLGKIEESQGNAKAAYENYSTAIAFDPNNFLAEQLSSALEETVKSEGSSAAETPEMQEASSLLSESEEISLDDFDLGDDNSSEEENVSNVSEEKESLTEKEAETTVQSDFSDDNMNVMEMDAENSLFESTEPYDSEEDNDTVSLDSLLDTPEENIDTEENSVDEGNFGTDIASEGENLANEETVEEENLASEENSAAEALIAEYNALDEEPLASEETATEENLAEESEESVDEEENSTPTVNIVIEQENSSPEEESLEAATEKETLDAEDLAPEAENLAEETLAPEAESLIETSYENLVDQVQEILPHLSSVIENPEEAEKFKKEIAMFSRLRDLGELLPFEQREKFLSGKIRLLLDYIIARLSGKKGLLKTASSLRENAKFPEIKAFPQSEIVSVNEVTGVMRYLEDLTYFLQDQNLAKALKMSAEEVLEKL